MDNTKYSSLTWEEAVKFSEKTTGEKLDRVNDWGVIKRACSYCIIHKAAKDCIFLVEYCNGYANNGYYRYWPFCTEACANLHILTGK